MQRFKDILYIATGALIVITMILAAIGWVRNVIQLFTSTFDPLTGEIVLKIVGIFIAPLGAIMGWV
tara:strand:+ start:694 stop:891 length:198 start_codon:yes stop_codon:yes gene_type:complete